LQNLQNVVYFTRHDVMGKTTREKALELLRTLYQEQGGPVTSKVIAAKLDVSISRIWHILGEAKQAGLARPIRQRGWEPILGITKSW
jgi:hypothetical protein